jgi:glutathione synthase
MLNPSSDLTMPSICLLSTATADAANDNPERLATAFTAAGWQVARRDQDAIRSGSGVLSIGPDQRRLDEFDLIWLLGLGNRQSFLDRMQLLANVPPGRMVNTSNALLELHAKHALPLTELADLHPETYASCDPQWLRSIVEGGGTWILKPTAGSFGRQVERVDASDPGLNTLLAELTGPDASRYCIVQRYVAEIESGETRVLVANCKVVGCYRRLPGPDHRANLSADARAVCHTLTASEQQIAQRVAEFLRDRGVRFAAIDIAGPYVIEYNIANPGGMETVERLTGANPASEVVAAFSS